MSILNSKLSYTIWIAIFTVTLLFGGNAYSEASEEQKRDKGYAEISHLMDVIELIREKYVDVDKVTYRKLVTNAMKGIMHGLDPFSSYLEPQFYSSMINQINGTGFGGLGIHIAVKDKKLKIIAPLHDSPAYKAGIKPNDTILFIDGEQTSSMSMDDCIKLLKGDPGTEVTLTIHRESENLTKEIKIVRDIISQNTVEWRHIKAADIGYIRISLFAKLTARDLDKALYSLNEKKISALIIDLRGNPGGLLQSAVEVCSRFIKEDELIVFIEGRSKSERKDFKSLSCKKMAKIPIAILINGNSASAAEILAGCLQDHKRAALIGERSFGKGSVQSIIPLPDKSAVRLTTAKYYTPSKRVIHEKGIEPDIVVDIDIPTENKLYSQGILYPGVVMPDNIGAIRDVQLERAIEILKGIRLFRKSSE